jgi:F-type H+-transporting ATPase subunit b
MLIDPFVVIAQIINFLILVALLKRFLYRPIAEAMEARSQRIERQLAIAAAKEQDAETEKELYEQKQRELQANKQKWLETTQQEVAAQKTQLTQQAKAEVSQMRSQWLANWESDRQKLLRQIQDSLSQQITLATRKALSDLANADLETQIIETFIGRLRKSDRSQLATNLDTSVSNDLSILINSSFTISDEQKTALINAIREKITQDAEIQFAIEEDLICGIELRYGGYKISWNVNSYLTELKTITAGILSENDR